MTNLKKAPFFLLMLPLFFCLHGSVENYGVLTVGEVLLTGVEILVCVMLFSFVVFFAVKNYIVASLITGFVATWYLFFGAIVDFLRTSAGLMFFSKYSVLLPLLVCITVACIIFLKRKKSIVPKLVLYLNILLLIYCSVDGILLLKKATSPQKVVEQVVAFDAGKVTARPNLYYLVFDAYTGYKSLKDSFGFANDSLYSFLAKKQFSILPVHSNYDVTLFSMSSVLNMKYVDRNYDTIKIKQRDLQLRANEIKYAAVFNIFTKMGYQIKNYSIFDIADKHGIASQNSFLPVHSVLLTDKILHNRIIRTATSLFAAGKLALPSWRKRYLFQHDANNLLSQELVIKTASEKNKQPFFCYAHFLLPHAPYYRDSSGKYNTPDIFGKWATDGNKPMYLSYLKYTNSVIKILVDQITRNDPQAIVILMSDHGFRNYTFTKIYEPRYFDNICAVRFPNKMYGDHRQQWSAVNLFRYVFNSQYGQQIPFLQDSTQVLSNSGIDF